MHNLTTGKLTDTLVKTGPSDVINFISENKDEMYAGEKPFASYMKRTISEKGLFIQDVIIRADLNDSYGYKIISEAKKTRNRDIILRICLAAKFSLEETQTALRLYKMSELYPRIPRDCVIISCIGSKIFDIYSVDEELTKAGMESIFEQ